MAQCISPFAKDGMALPCGRCYPCLSRRVSGWSYRLVKEGQRSQSAFFVTFTYDTHHVPITTNGYMSLCKSDYQRFIKRLRKDSPGQKIRYFAVGEYGGNTMRPHYHAIMFNVDILKVERHWTLGLIHVGDVAEASIGYTLKYMMKKSRIPLHQRDDRVPEFQLMSKGIGANYLTSSMKRWHKKDLTGRMYCPLPDGKKIAMPRYYKEKVYTKLQRQLIGNAYQQIADKNQLSDEQEYSKLQYYAQKLEQKSRINEVL